MFKITDSLYIHKNENVTYATIVQNDLSGCPCEGFKIVLKTSGCNSPVNVGISTNTSFATLIPKLRTMASSLNLVRLTETLYIKSPSTIRMIQNVNGYLKIRLDEAYLSAWPSWVSNDDADSIMKEIMNNCEVFNNSNVINQISTCR